MTIEKRFTRVRPEKNFTRARSEKYGRVEVSCGGREVERRDGRNTQISKFISLKWMKTSMETLR